MKVVILNTHDVGQVYIMLFAAVWANGEYIVVADF
jgi:hypothetical protein